MEPVGLGWLRGIPVPGSSVLFPAAGRQSCCDSVRAARRVSQRPTSNVQRLWLRGDGLDGRIHGNPIFMGIGRWLWGCVAILTQLITSFRTHRMTFGGSKLAQLDVRKMVIESCYKSGNMPWLYDIMCVIHGNLCN